MTKAQHDRGSDAAGIMLAEATEPAWQENGGRRSKKGCAWATGTSTGRARVGTLYTYTQRKYWCWNFRKKKVHNISVDTYSRPRAWGFEPRGSQLAAGYYAWWNNNPKSGHYSGRYGHLAALCDIWFLPCFHHYYPYVRIYVHADGTYHASGKDG